MDTSTTISLNDARAADASKLLKNQNRMRMYRKCFIIWDSLKNGKAAPSKTTLTARLSFYTSLSFKLITVSGCTNPITLQMVPAVRIFPTSLQNILTTKKVDLAWQYPSHLFSMLRKNQELSQYVPFHPCYKANREVYLTWYKNLKNQGGSCWYNL